MREGYRQGKAGRISRREFMRGITLLGVSLGAGTIGAQCATSTPERPNLPAAKEASPTKEVVIEKATSTEAVAANQLEIFHWWLGGSHEESLQALYNIYQRENPGVEIINAVTAGGMLGGEMRAVLQNRMLDGDPPDTFIVHLGHELIDTHAIPGRMEPLDSLYQEEGWNEVFPPDLLTIASWDGHPWSVPVNIHRSNVLWWNTMLFQEAGIDAPPETFDEFLTTAARLKDAGFDGLLIAEAQPGWTAHVFEDILAGHLTPSQYRGLWTGDTEWNGAEVEAALMFLKEVLENFANDDYMSLDWGGTNARFQEDSVGMMIMGDWVPAELKTMGFTNYAAAPMMGTKGVFVMLSDSFGLPQGAPHRKNAINWLRVCGSKEGQENFNIHKGSIPARADVDLGKFNAYQQSAIKDFKTDELVPSVMHGAAAKDSWVGDYVMAINTFVHNKDIKQAQENLTRACETAGV